jgi:ParB-like chromosome segregation protein Spo0J
MIKNIKDLLSTLPNYSFSEQVEIINTLREEIHKYSPFKDEPVDFVKWVPSHLIEANDYNPNSVAPPEMKLLEKSIKEDGYTQPIVSWKKETMFEVVDGFHRNRVGKESKAVSKRINGYLPLVIINNNREDIGDRMASTIRHNRARGKHKVEAMSEIVLDLKRRNWNDEKIARELGMDADEVLRLTQITGLAEMFKDRAFSEAWQVGSINEDDSLVDSQEEST